MKPGSLIWVMAAALILCLCVSSITAAPVAAFCINANEEVTTENDSISSGVHLVQYSADIVINNLDDDSDTVLGNITIESEAENIASVDYTDEPEVTVLWNQTYAKWIFPQETVINEGKTKSTWWKTNYYYSQYIPMKMKRWINQTEFSSDGYQLVTFNVTFENKTYDYILGTFLAEKSPLEFVDATLLNETFSTDAPIKSISTTGDQRHQFNFYLDSDLIELGKPYQFSMVVRVNVTTDDGSPVKYTPRCAMGLGDFLGYDIIGTGYSISMPSGALPLHAHSAAVITNVSNSWSYSNGFMQTMSFNQSCRKLVPIPKPLPGFTAKPTDPDNDGIYEDLNGNGRLDFADVVLYFNQMEWIALNEPVSAFDLNGNSRIDFADIVKLFGEI